MEHSVKSEMSKWTKSYSYQLTAEQIQAVENNDISKFKTTFGGKETMMQIWKEKPFGDYFGQKYAESYDEAAWFRARCAYLEYKNYELEEQMKFLDTDGKPCDRCNEPVCYEGNEGRISNRDEAIICSECFAREEDEDRYDECEESEDEEEECPECNVSKANEGGCDCQIVTCNDCGEEDHKYNHNLGGDGLLRCDECDINDPRRACGLKCQGSDCKNKLKTEDERRAMMCLGCTEQWKIHDKEEMTRIRKLKAENTKLKEDLKNLHTHFLQQREGDYAFFAANH